ncbi:MAG TPA: hypothetical protein VIT01_09915 [Acidimicrobiales bacterium]
MSRLRLLLALTLVVGAGAGCSDDSDGSATGSRREFCAELRAVVEAHLTIFDPLQPASREDTGQAMDRLAAAAPEAIATEMTRLADTFEAVVEVLDEVNPSDPDAADRLAALDIDEDEITAAQATVNAFALDKCRIDLAAINAESVPTTPTTTPTTLPPATAPAETTVAPTTVAPTTVPPVPG